jgi:superfamily II DNA helicase RecQ
MKIDNTLVQKKLFTLLTAPVAKGKTRTFMEFYHQNYNRVIFVSPLRALAAEVYEKFKDEKNIFWTGEKGLSSKEEVWLNFIRKKKALMVTTVELLDDDFLNLIADDEEPILFVFDEFHLFYEWGERFRPILHDKFLGVLNSEHPVLALSATINESILEKIQNDLKYYQDYFVYLNFGNQELFRKPNSVNVFKGHEKSVMNRVLLNELKQKNNSDVFLLFCSYREEVDDFVQRLKQRGYRVIGCVGGEVDKFQNGLKESEGEVDCIVSTIALSHGVNLPEISKVFINYEVKNYDFWLQMVGRGGRSGRVYDVYTYDTYSKENLDLLWDYWKIGIRDWISF